jgi:cytochrome c553
MDINIQREDSMQGGRRRVAKFVGLHAIVQGAILTLAFSAISRAPDASVSEREFQAKFAYCKVCHGPTGQGFHGYYPIPRLAGQQFEYFKNQLQAFFEHRRTNNIMFNVSHVLSREMITGLADNFHDLSPKPLGGGPKDFVAAGKKIYEDGIPDSNVPACASCHGPEAKGEKEFPRLAGQLYDYIVDKLTNWSKERGQNPDKPDTSAIMEPIAHGLSEPQIKAVAAYVSYLD